MRRGSLTDEQEGTSPVQKELTERLSSIKNAILACFKRTMPEEKITLLTMKLKLNEKHFLMATLEKKFKGAGLSEQATKIVQEICLLITRRIKDNIDPNHPHHLLCFELINWLVATVSSLGPSKEPHEKMLNRMGYLAALFVEDGVFLSDDPADEAMRTMLGSVKDMISVAANTKPRSKSLSSPRYPNMKPPTPPTKKGSSPQATRKSRAKTTETQADTTPPLISGRGKADSKDITQDYEKSTS